MEYNWLKKQKKEMLIELIIELKEDLTLLNKDNKKLKNELLMWL
jgi:hypothetical protein